MAGVPKWICLFNANTDVFLNVSLRKFKNFEFDQRGSQIFKSICKLKKKSEISIGVIGNFPQIFAFFYASPNLRMIILTYLLYICVKDMAKWTTKWSSNYNVFWFWYHKSNKILHCFYPVAGLHYFLKIPFKHFPLFCGTYNHDL